MESYPHGTLSRGPFRLEAEPAAVVGTVASEEGPDVSEWIGDDVCSGYPIKLLNYLALGLPTVCVKGSSRPLAGIVTTPNGDVPAFQSALRTLAEEQQRRESLGMAGAEFVRTHCSWDSRARDLEFLYEQVLTEKSNRRQRSLPRIRASQHA